LAREQTENLDAFGVAPRAWTPQGLPAGIQIRVLNEDDQSGAVTALLDIPGGWAWPSGGFCAADQEFFVLAGKLTIGSAELANGGYCFYPRGTRQQGWQAPQACRVFAIFNGRPDYAVTPAPDVDAASDRVVEHLDSWAMEWFDPLAASEPSVAFRPGIFVKVLRHDPDTGVSTHLAGLMPGWFAEGIEVHPVREESLTISGDVKIGLVSGEPGYTCVVGSYYSRPPGVPHGPLATKNGNVGIVHTEGLLGIDYQTDARAGEIIRDHLRHYPWA
jgi:hypothetical protein